MLALRSRSSGSEFGGGGGDDNGEAEREETERWFRRAMDANPDNYGACLQRMIALQGDWRGGGSAEALRFARACAAEGNYYGRIPFLLAEAHAQASQTTGDRDAYLRDPAVWAELRAIYHTHLSIFPDHDYYRSGFAKWAVDCGRWAEAKPLFDAIAARGEPDARPFGGEDACQLYRERATEEFARARQRPPQTQKAR
jgi:hypothetical protein